MANDAAKRSIDHRVIIEIACVSSPKELLAIRQAYHARYKLSLEEDVASHTSGDCRKVWPLNGATFQLVFSILELSASCSLSSWILSQLLVALVSTYRYDGAEVNENLSELEARTLHDAIVAVKSVSESDGKERNESLEQSTAEILYKAIEQKTFHHDELIRILSTRSRAQLTTTFNRYKDEYGTSITKVN